LAFDFEDVEGEEDLLHVKIAMWVSTIRRLETEERKVRKEGDTYDFTDPRQTARRGLHHQLALPLSERISELGLEVFVDEVAEPRLPAEFVHALGDFVACGVAEPGEEGEEFAGEGGVGVFPEDDGAEAGLGDLYVGEGER
jgi:hypothetical protein